MFHEASIPLLHIYLFISINYKMKKKGEGNLRNRDERKKREELKLDTSRQLFSIAASLHPFSFPLSSPLVKEKAHNKHLSD